MTSCSKRRSTTGWPWQLLALTAAAALLAGCASSPDKPKAGAEELPGTEAEAPDLGDPQARFEAAVTLLQRSDLDGAEAAFRKLEADFPEYAGPATNLGLIHLRKQEYEQAVGAFSRAQERGAGNATNANGLGIAYRELGQLGAAETAYQRALSFDPNYALAHFNLGILYDKYLQRPRQAIAAYQRYLQLTEDEELRVHAWIAALQQGAPAAVEQNP